MAGVIKKVIEGKILVWVFFPLLSGQTSDFISILIWTSPEREPFNFLERGYEPFTKRKCNIQKCFLTQNRSLFTNVAHFDVLLFNPVDFYFEGTNDLPRHRNNKQKYVLISTEPAGRYPLPSKLNMFFNMTWTYKLDSDVVFPYIIVKNSSGEVIGPKEKMEWNYDYQNVEVPRGVVNKLLNKKTAAAIFMTNCWANKGERLNFVYALKNELLKLGQDLHIYGKCGMRCGSDEECYARIESDYFFYLAFENSFCDDYVSEKVLHGLQHYAVPVVLGGANYTRFMPDRIYLNADLEPSGLAKQMVEIINDTSRYHDFFKWHGHYSFHHVKENNYHDTVCEFCALLNNQRGQRVFYRNIADWWNPYQDQEEPIRIEEPQYDSEIPQEDLLTKDESVISKIFNIFKFFTGD